MEHLYSIALVHNGMLGCGHQSCDPTFLQVDAVMSEAARQPIDGRIHLPLPASLRSLVTVESYPVVRASSGGAATFHCSPLRILPNVNRSNANNTTVMWVHNHKMLAALNSDGLRYNYTASSDITQTVDWAAASATLTMRNVTWASRGLVGCLQECEADPVYEHCPLHIFRFHVTPTANELFLAPLMHNLTVVRSGEARFRCITSLIVPTDVFHGRMGFIWRYNAQWLAAPQYHALEPFVGPVATPPPRRPSPKHVPPWQRNRKPGETLAEYSVFNSDTDPDNFTSTLVIPAVQLQASTPARVECWVQPDHQREVWLMQTAYLHVLPASDA
ncbi:uncharacterized protein LOC129598210 isoform X3 [Paramacrobiotus metropolitanus]|uniref:uncharacterized protein LOC129598210 isoform X3 n=1 Tax=Paramacrobiotus metropolitanus TaxID=2943436 RepID=UPI00244651C5|nr:uncharacterized protein LOC129598210 isoform X3 [Paramacrobiotus metropolitanus]